MGHGHFNIAAIGWISYNPGLEYPDPEQLYRTDSIHDMLLQPYDEGPLLPSPNRTITFEMGMNVLEDGATQYVFPSSFHLNSLTPLLIQLVVQ